MREKTTRTRLLLLLIAVLSVACSGDDGPSDELDTFLRDIAAAQDEHFAKTQTYTAELDALEGIDGDEAVEMNLIINVNRDVGYCLEGDDETGTWHIAQGSDLVLEGDCP